MIDVSQWRASIGLWNYCQAPSSRPANGCHSHSFKAAVDSKSGSTGYIQEEKRCTLPAVLFIIGFIVIYFCVLLLKQNSIPPPDHCYCYQVQCTTGDIATDTLQSVVLPGDININSLISRLLLLSGDVELNPGPTVEEACAQVKEVLRSHYAVLEEATKGSLSSILSHLYAKKIITKPVRDSLSYSKMIHEFEATLLVSKDESELKRHCQVFLECISQSGPTDAVAKTLAIEWGKVFGMESLLPVALTVVSSTPSPSPVSDTALTCFSPINDDLFTASPPQQFSNVSAGVTPHDINIKPFENKEIEEKVYTSLDDLHQWFSKLAKNFKFSFREKNKHNSQLATDVSEWLIAHMKWEEGSVNSSFDDIFKKIQPYYDFIDCKLLLDLSKEFLQDVTFTDGNGVTYKLVNELHSHTLTSKRLRTSNTVSELRKLLQEHYKPFDKNMNNLPCINIYLQTCWDDISIDGLYKLIEKFLPQKYRQSIVDHITIFSGSIVIKLHILDSTADSLIEYTGGKLQFMHLIGIFSLYINNYPVLQEDENMNFTFELALLEAVTTGNNEAVEFLLQLETVNIDHTNEEGKTALMIACEKGHEDIVDSLLSAGANVNIQDINGWTALMIASEHNHVSIIHMLLQANANPHLKKLNGSNAVMIASGNGNVEVAELLISKGVDYKYQREDGVNAFMLACQNGHTQVVELLLKEEIDPNVQKKDGWNAFMLACQKGHTQIVELLLKEQVDPNVKRNSGGNAFMLACQYGHTQIVELLLKEQVDLNVQRNNGGNAFMLACQNGHTQVVELLLKKQVDPNVQIKDGANAFMLACQNGHTQIVKLLLKEQVDPNVQKISGGNAFMLACHNGHTQIVELLLKEQAGPNVQKNDGVNAFMLACQNGHTQVVELLLKKQVDPNVQRNSGGNAFMLACQYGHTQIVELLLKEQVDPNVQDKDGWNAFMLACQNGHTHIVELLLKEQVDPNVKKNDGWNAFMSACENGHTQIVELLLKEQVDPNVQAKGLNAFMSACENGHTQIVELLLKEQVDPNVQKKDGMNAFMFACKNGHMQIVKLLLKGQVDPNVQKKDGVTALMIASFKGHYEVVKLLLEWKADPTIKSKEGKTALSYAKTEEMSVLINSYLSEHNIEQSDAVSIFSFRSSSITSSISSILSLCDVSSIRSVSSNVSS